MRNGIITSTPLIRLNLRRIAWLALFLGICSIVGALQLPWLGAGAISHAQGTAEAFVDLRITPARTVNIGDTLHVVATVTDRASGSPLAGRRVAFVYNEEWNFRAVATTNSSGQAVWDMPVTNRSNSSGFVEGGGSHNSGTDYGLRAVFFGDDTYARQDALAFFKVGATGVPRTRVTIESLNARQLAGGTDLQVHVRITDDSGSPMYMAGVRAKALFRSQGCTADWDGRCTITLSTTGRPPGLYTVQAEYVGSGNPPYGGSFDNMSFFITSGPPPQERPAPLVYLGWDWDNTDPAQHPNWGAFGGTIAVEWGDVYGNGGWGLLDRYLGPAKNMHITLPDGRVVPKPYIIGISIYQTKDVYSSPSGYYHRDLTPGAVQAAIGGSYIIDGGPNCPGINGQRGRAVAPRYDDPRWQAAYRDTVLALRDWLNAHPEYNDVLVGFRVNAGIDDEAFKTKNVSGCNFDDTFAQTVNDSKFEGWIHAAISYWREAFPDKPVFLDGSFREYMGEYDTPVGNKWNGAIPHGYVVPYKSISQQFGGMLYQWYPELPHAFESQNVPFFFGGIEPGPHQWAGTYWMFLQMLSQRPWWVDIHGDHYPSCDNVPGLCDWVNAHIGVNAHTTPSVFTVMREVQDADRKEAATTAKGAGWWSRNYGDYNFYLYRVETVAGGGTVPVQNVQLPAAAQNQYYTLWVHNTWEGIPSEPYVARRTGKTGSDHAMYFDIDDSYPYAGQDPTSQSLYWRIRVVYLDQGSDTWSLEYQTKSGTVKKLTVQKQNSGAWVEKVWTVTDLYANNQFAGGTDFRLNDNSDGTDTFHLAEASGSGALPTPRPTPPPPPPTFTPTATPVGPPPTATATPVLPPTWTPLPSATPTPGTPPRTLDSRHVNTPPTLDGLLDDWPATADIQVDATTADTVAAQPPSLADLSATVRSVWDVNNLYLAFEITDDALIADSAALWHDDSIELGLDGAHDYQSFNHDDHQYTFAIDGRLTDYALATTTSTWAMKHTPNGYTVEMSVPWSELGGSIFPQIGRRLGFTVGLHDDDNGGGYDSYLIWEGYNTQNASIDWGDIQLADGPPQSPTPSPPVTATPVQTATPLPTATSTPLPTATGTPLPTATDTPVPTVTDTPVPTGTTSPTTCTWSDDFSSTALQSGWSWVRQDSQHWSLTARPGYLQIRTQGGELGGSYNDAHNILLRDAPAGDFTWQTTVDFSPQNNYQQAGLLVYQDDDNYIKLVRVYGDAQKAEFANEQNQAYTGQTAFFSGVPSFLRIRRVGNEYIGGYSADGQTWTEFAPFSNTNFSNVRLGLLATNSLGGLTSIHADYDSVCVKETGSPPPQQTSTATATATATTIPPTATPVPTETATATGTATPPPTATQPATSTPTPRPTFTPALPTATPTAAPTPPAEHYMFGVVNNLGYHYSDERQKGLQVTLLPLRWDIYEKQPGNYSLVYVSYVQQELDWLRSQGWKVILDPGYQHAPDWVFQYCPNGYFVNQAGDQYKQTNDAPPANGVFDPCVRSYIGSYLRRVFRDLGTDFYSVRIGGGPDGYLQYPPAEYNTHKNSYWAFDTNARQVMPADVDLWVPGTMDNANQRVLNAGFEESSTRYTPVLDWVVPAGTDASITTANPRQGSHALRVAAGDAAVYQFVPVSPNKTYYVGVGFRSDGATTAKVKVEQSGITLNPFTWPLPREYQTTNATWQYTGENITTAGNAHYLRITLQGAGTGDVFFDDLQVVQTGYPPTSNRRALGRIFLDAYVNSLVDYENWQINEVRRSYAGHIDVAISSKGALPEELPEALMSDLVGATPAEQRGDLQNGLLVDRLVAGILDTSLVDVYLGDLLGPAGVTAQDTSNNAGAWSAARWVSEQTTSRHLSVWGGNRDSGTAGDLQLAVQRMRDNNFWGLLWSSEADLYDTSGAGWATIDDYASIIASFCNLQSDFSGDGRIDGTDVAIVAQTWRTSSGAPAYRSSYDLDHNGVVNLADVMLVAQEMGSGCQ